MIAWLVGRSQNKEGVRGQTNSDNFAAVNLLSLVNLLLLLLLLLLLVLLLLYMTNRNNRYSFALIAINIFIGNTNTRNY